MLRTNQSFLKYIEVKYQQQQRKEDIVIRQYTKGQMLLQQDATATKIMLIKEGITKCFLTEKNDKDFIFEFLGEGEIIGEIEYLRKTTCLCNVQAITDVNVFAISISYFEELLHQDLKLNNILLHVFADRIVNTSSRASFQQLNTIEHNLAILMHLQHQQKIIFSKDDIAAYLGISTRSLNRVLKNLNLEVNIKS